MFAYLNGKIEELTPVSVVIDTHGIGWFVNISLNTYTQLKELAYAKIFTHHLVREDAQTLYGFFDDKERRLFIHLISVSGVGAATAMVMLSSMSINELLTAIRQENVVKIKSVKGIGLKTAQRIIIDLKDKLSKEDLDDKIAAQIFVEDNEVKTEGIAALIVMGYNRMQAEKAITKILSINPQLSVENLIKEAIRML
ncbi:MAG: Holliday junction branch migration protein RuvA [Bacteroidales bacterium]|jgi:Holliday junction DNA helicase RuvA|nr:Holliday junction branch migration protein RuvA [Bacteroidales bacterium]